MKRVMTTGGFALIGALLATTTCGFSAAAEAKTHITSSSAGKSAHHLTTARATSGTVHLTAYTGHRRKLANLKGAKYRYASYGGLQCVPFARAASGIELKGNAANWWDAAAGVYERGARPEPGSVLNFRATGGMRLGHVAVVTAVIDSRQIEIEHANWSKGSVARNVDVVDVSPDNDWTQVRVALGRTGAYGGTYPTYGFIYDRPDAGTMVANDSHAAASGRIVAQTASYDEVAQVPTGSARGNRKPLLLDLPARSIQ